jgi:hypothetical protein
VPHSAQRGWSLTRVSFRPDWLAMTALSDADLIWNRAAAESGGPSPGPGDAALSAVLRFHSLAMSGGVLDALECLSRVQIGEAVQGFRWFGLDEAASFLEAAFDQWQSADRTPEVEVAMEAEFDPGYSMPIPSDDTIATAFRGRYAEDPLAFAPAS